MGRQVGASGRNVKSSNVPTLNGINPINGYLSSNAPPNGLSRDDDKADMAYFRLEPNLSSQLHPSFRPAELRDLQLSDELEDGDFFTFVGYPWRKTRRTPGVQQTDLTTYTAHALSSDVYDNLGYNRRVHIVTRMRLKKTHSYRYSSLKVAPHPQGISGGAVLSWPRTNAGRSPIGRNDEFAGERNESKTPNQTPRRNDRGRNGASDQGIRPRVRL